MNKFKKFLVVPSSKWQLGLIKYLKKNKFKVNTLDDDDKVIGHKYADARVNINTKNISKIKLLCKKKKLFPISSCSDFGSKIVNKIRGKNIDHFNKIKQRKIEKKLKLNTPLFFTNKNFNLKNFKKCNYKVISKPIIGSGSNDVNYHEKFKKYNNDDIFYEEYIDGTEYNVEGVVYNKKLYFFAIMQKKKSKFVSYILKSESLNQKIIDEIKKTVSLLILNSGYPNGPFHTEIIVQKNSNKIFIVESHPREAGFDMFFFTCGKLTGLDLYKTSIYLKLKKKIDIRNFTKKKLYSNYCCRMIPIKKKGKLKRIYFKKFKDQQGIKTYINIFSKKNENLKNNYNDSSRMASIQSFSNNNQVNLENYTLKILKKYFVAKYY